MVSFLLESVLAKLLRELSYSVDHCSKCLGAFGGSSLTATSGFSFMHTQQ
jgi:hypothetical protein